MYILYLIYLDLAINNIFYCLYIYVYICNENNYSDRFVAADQQRVEFIGSLCKNGMQFSVKREDVYHDLLKLYTTSCILLESFPLSFEYKDELAVDQGGVCRDVFSGFWEQAFKEQFDGMSLLTPATHLGVDFEIWPTIGTILSHGFLVCGFLPVRVGFPCIAHILCGQVSIPDSILIECFADSLNTHESTVIKEAVAATADVACFSSLQQSVLAILSRYGCRNLPTSDNLKKLMLNAVKYFAACVLEYLSNIYAFGVVRVSWSCMSCIVLSRQIHRKSFL